MIRIVNWTARRAGGRITINGTNADTEKAIKVVGIDRIAAGSQHTQATHFPIATDKDGVQYELGI